MGLANSPDIFQEKISSLMDGLEFVRTYLDDCLCLRNGTWTDHIQKLDEVLKRLKEAGLKVNADKSFFGQSQLEYLGYWITRNGIQPLPKKVDAIRNLAKPQTCKELRQFISIVNYYCDMCIHQLDTLAPLTALTSSVVGWIWTDEHQRAFNKAKQIVSQEVMLAFPDFNLPFEIHTDASKLQLGAVISQNKKLIAFFSRKLTPAQTSYTTTEHELLAIVETLKEFRNILLGHHIKVYTDHQNLTYTNFNTDCVMRWRLILEEYGPELCYTKGSHNIVADALSRLELTDDTSLSLEEFFERNAQWFGMTKDTQKPTDVLSSFPLTYRNIKHAQRHDHELLRSLEQKDTYSLKIFCGGGKKRELIVYNEKIVILKSLQRSTVEWYHEYLCHPGETCTEQTIRLHFWWENLRRTVHDVCTKCMTCQITKK
jgi:RNase H-like domain found in reverse transcriptase/Integrase zinc binding domain/Reverse transcriptase (RNA-dependent DNA polymerase)